MTTTLYAVLLLAIAPAVAAATDGCPCSQLDVGPRLVTLEPRLT